MKHANASVWELPSALQSCRLGSTIRPVPANVLKLLAKKESTFTPPTANASARRRSAVQASLKIHQIADAVSKIDL